MKLSSEASRAIREAFIDAFTVADALRNGSVELRQHQTLRRRLDDLLVTERARLLAAKVPDRWIKAIQIPVVALVDEAAWGSPVRPLAEAWESLQGPMFGGERLGDRFFDDLEALRASDETPVEVLEIYGRCLMFGYKGRYARQETEPLRIVREGLRLSLLERLSPQSALSEGLDRDPDERRSPPTLAHWVVPTMGLAMVAMIAVALAVGLSWKADLVEVQLKTLSVETDRGTGPGETNRLLEEEP